MDLVANHTSDLILFFRVLTLAAKATPFCQLGDLCRPRVVRCDVDTQDFVVLCGFQPLDGSSHTFFVFQVQGSR